METYACALEAGKYPSVFIKVASGDGRSLASWIAREATVRDLRLWANVHTLPDRAEGAPTAVLCSVGPGDPPTPSGTFRSAWSSVGKRSTCVLCGCSSVRSQRDIVCWQVCQWLQSLIRSAEVDPLVTDRTRFLLLHHPLAGIFLHISKSRLLTLPLEQQLTPSIVLSRPDKPPDPSSGGNINSMTIPHLTPHPTPPRLFHLGFPHDDPHLG